MKKIYYLIGVLGILLLSSSCSGSEDVIEEKKEPVIVNINPPVKDKPNNGEENPNPTTEVNTINLNNWELGWSDEFDYENSKLDEEWNSQNGSSFHILSSRWRENVVVANGIVELQNKKENRGGQNWTSGNIWTKKKFKYGYFECKYKYSAAGATNNSFWFFSRGITTAPGAKECEIDVNEGHFPNEINTNIHNFDDVITRPDGSTTHPTDSKSFAFGIKPDYSFPLEIPITTKKIRLTSNNANKFHIREFRVYNTNNGNYPEVLSNTADTDVAGLVNYAREAGVKITPSGFFNESTFPKERVVDGNTKTSWVTQTDGMKSLELEWNREIVVGAIQFINGWQNEAGDWNDLVQDFKVQYLKNGEWVDISVLDVEQEVNFAEEFQTYGLEWGTSMKVDYVRHYTKKK